MQHLPGRTIRSFVRDRSVWLPKHWGARNWAIVAIGFVLALSLYHHRPYLDLDIQGTHSWRQAATMWNIRNFARHDPNIFTPRIGHFDQGIDNVQRLEFPIMQWSIGMTQRLVGEQIIWVRLIMYLIGCIAAVGFYRVARLLDLGFWPSLGAMGLFVYAPLFFQYAVNPLPDMLALAAAIWYLYYILRYDLGRRWADLWWAGGMLGLATAAKLPYLMFSAVSIFFFFKDLRREPSAWVTYIRAGLIQLLCVLPAGLWYLYVSREWLPSAVTHGIFAEGLFTPRNGEIFSFHRDQFLPWVYLSPAAWLPAAAGLLVAIDRRSWHWIFSLVFITGLYFTLEINAIEVVHDYYMLPFLPWAYLLTGLGFAQLRTRPALQIVCVVVAMLWAALWTPKRTAVHWSVERAYMNPDIFTYSEELAAAAPDSAKAIFVNDKSTAVFSYRVDKRGITFGSDRLPHAWIEDLIRRGGVRYLYSDSDSLNNAPGVLALTAEKVLQRGSVSVIRLKSPEELPVAQ